MRRLCLALLCLLANGLPASADPPLPGPPLAGEMSRFNFAAPQEDLSRLSLTDAEDHDVSLAQYRGKVVLLNVWATWCGPCVSELPELDHLQTVMGGRDFVIVPVSIDRGGAHKAEPFLRRMAIASVPVLFDSSNSIGRLMGAERIPLSIVIGRDGNEIGRFVGSADWDSSEARALLQYLIANGGDAIRAKYARPDQVALKQ